MHVFNSIKSIKSINKTVLKCDFRIYDNINLKKCLYVVSDLFCTSIVFKLLIKKETSKLSFLSFSFLVAMVSEEVLSIIFHKSIVSSLQVYSVTTLLSYEFN